MTNNKDDIYILELAGDDFVKNRVPSREQNLRSQTIDALVSRELKKEKELTGFAKLRQKAQDYTIHVGIASGVSGLVGYLQDESVAEYAVKGGLVAVTYATVLYGVGKLIKYLKSSPIKTDEDKRKEKVKEYENLLSARDTYQKSNHKVALVGTAAGLFTIVSGVLVAAPYTVLGALCGIGAGTGLAAGTTVSGVTGTRVSHLMKRKLEQYDLERARIVGSEMFKK